MSDEKENKEKPSKIGAGRAILGVSLAGLLAGGLAVNSTVSFVKKTFFDTPLKTFATVTAGTALYIATSCQPQIDKAYNGFKEWDSTRIVQVNQEAIDSFQTYKSMFEETKKQLENVIGDNEIYVTTMHKNQHTIDSLTGVMKGYDKILQNSQDLNKSEIKNLKNLYNGAAKKIKSLEIENDALESKLTSITNKIVESKTEPVAKQQTQVYATTQQNDFGGKDYWVVVREGNTLSGLAQKYFGNGSLYQKIAKMNGISNPADVPLGQPLILPSDGLVSTSGLRTDDVPDARKIKRGQSLTDFVWKNYDVKNNSEANNVANTIKEFNKNYGNNLKDMRFAVQREQVVYLPK